MGVLKLRERTMGKEKVLLVGGAGYIGSHVAIEFEKQGYQVGIFDNFSTGLRSNIRPKSILIEGDMRNPKDVENALSQGWDAVVHLAAWKAAGESMIYPDKYWKNNIAGSLTLMDGCVTHGIKAFLLSSSAGVYGEPQKLPLTEDHPLNPVNYYGYTKVAIEENLRWYHLLKGLPYASLRYFNAAGYDLNGEMLGLEQDPQNLIPIVMEVATGKRKELQVFGGDYDTPDGTCIRDYIHVTDLARAHVLAVKHTLNKGGSLIVNLGSEVGDSVLDVVESARKWSQKEIPAKIVDRRAGDPGALYASSSYAKEVLGWQAEVSDLDTIIKSTWEVYKKNLG